VLWFLLWFVLIAGALAFFALLGVRLWRQLKLLTAELTTAADRLAQVSAAMDELSSPPGADSAGRR
jgi:hypothetical protein